VIGKDRELLALVAVHNPHLAGTILKLCNELQDGKRLGELPPPELLTALGYYVQDIGRLIVAVAQTGTPAS